MFKFQTLLDFSTATAKCLRITKRFRCHLRCRFSLQLTSLLTEKETIDKIKMTTSQTNSYKQGLWMRDKKNISWQGSCRRHSLLIFQARPLCLKTSFSKLQALNLKKLQVIFKLNLSPMLLVSFQALCQACLVNHQILSLMMPPNQSSCQMVPPTQNLSKQEG